MKNYWWKVLGVFLVLYALVAGLLNEVPRQPILHETIRNLHYHVPMWFAMMIVLFASVVYSIRSLMSNQPKDDIIAEQLVKVGVLFGCLGLCTGMFWARFTWDEWWSNDPKQVGAGIGVLIYMAYLLLRDSIEDPQRKATVASVYNIFAFCIFIPLIWILPRLTDSLHPGTEGNPGFNQYDLDSKLRMVFYPAIIGWTLMGVWMANIGCRAKMLKNYIKDKF